MLDLHGWRILVPESRVGGSIPAQLLARAGADVIRFPRLVGGPPSSWRPLDAAISCLDDFHLVVVSGRLSALHLLQRTRLAARRCEPKRLAAIGHGAAKVLRENGVRVDAEPVLHTPDGIADALAPLCGTRLLLVREQAAAPDLNRALASRGADVSEVAGFRLEVLRDDGLARTALAVRPDLAALVNPTAVRMLVAGAAIHGLDLQRCLGGVPIAAVGPQTAASAGRHGLEPDLISGGRVRDLLADLDQLCAPIPHRP